MDIRDVLQETVNRHTYRIALFNQIKSIRSIADHGKREMVAIRYGRNWSFLALTTESREIWKACISAVNAVGMACWEIHDRKGALEIARNERAAQVWNGDWDEAYETSLEVI
jgi:hypothetical protein